MLRRRTPRSLRERMNESRFDNYRNRRRIYESSEVDDFIEDIEKAYKKYFPKSLINIRKTDILGSKDITADCYLAKDESEVPHRILDNDTFRIRFCIENLENFNDLPDHLMIFIIVILNSYRSEKLKVMQLRFSKLSIGISSC